MLPAAFICGNVNNRLEGSRISSTTISMRNNGKRRHFTSFSTPLQHPLQHAQPTQQHQSSLLYSSLDQKVKRRQDTIGIRLFMNDPTSSSNDKNDKIDSDNYDNDGSSSNTNPIGSSSSINQQDDDEEEMYYDDNDDYIHVDDDEILNIDEDALLELLEISADQELSIELNEDSDYDDELDEEDDSVIIYEMEQLEQLLQDNELEFLSSIPPPSEQSLSSLSSSISSSISWDNDDDDDDDSTATTPLQSSSTSRETSAKPKLNSKATKPSALEQALLQGVVPAEAGVGSGCLPGDYGFDPLNLATKDYFSRVQNFLLNLFPETDTQNISNSKEEEEEERPSALILRDYREAEIRHGRLAMLAAILWPLQEIVDRFFIPNNLFSDTTVIYGGITLPYISLFMTLCMLLLGYLDIYAASIKDIDTGDAFLPGECFWDPLSILEGAPDSMKRNMQLRELNNGRFAMIAVLSYILQEGITHQPLITLPWNYFLFEPAFEIPAVQAWLDGQFSGATVVTPLIPDELKDELDTIVMTEDYKELVNREQW